MERLADGSYLVSFEHHHRIWRYPPALHLGAARAQPLHLPDRLRRLPQNGGFEAMAPLADGSLLLVFEKLRNDRGDFVGWIWRQGGASELSYAATGLFHPTDFALLPGGDVLALERRFTLVGGASARLQRISKTQIRAGARLEGREIARLELPLTVDNFEGLAVGEESSGSLSVYLISDNNFSIWQRTLLMQFRLRDVAKSGTPPASGMSSGPSAQSDP